MVTLRTEHFSSILTVTFYSQPTHYTLHQTHDASTAAAERNEKILLTKLADRPGRQGKQDHHHTRTVAPVQTWNADDTRIDRQ